MSYFNEKTSRNAQTCFWSLAYLDVCHLVITDGYLLPMGYPQAVVYAPWGEDSLTYSYSKTVQKKKKSTPAETYWALQSAGLYQVQNVD